MAGSSLPVLGQDAGADNAAASLSKQIVSLMMAEAESRHDRSGARDPEGVPIEESAQADSARKRGLAGIRGSQAPAVNQDATSEPAVRKSFKSGNGVRSEPAAEPSLHVSRKGDRIVMRLLTELFDADQTYLPAQAYPYLDEIARAVSILQYQLPSTRYTLEVYGQGGEGRSSELAGLRALAIERYLLVRHALSDEQMPVTAQTGESLAHVRSARSIAQSDSWLQLVGHFQE